MEAGDIMTVWCDPARGGAPVGFRPPADASGLFLATNDVASLASLLKGTSFEAAFVFDVAEVARIVFPETPAEVFSAIPDAEGLDDLWLMCVSRLDAIPGWAHLALSSFCLDMEERALGALFFRWGKSLDDGSEKRWADSFPSNLKRVERRPLPTLADCTPLDPDDVAARLGPDGALARNISGYEPRPGQLKMLKAVVGAFNDGRHLVVEAGTGIGKSLAYLLPAALWARTNDIPVVVSTNTKNLQSQLVEKDLPAVLKVLDAEPAFSDRPLQAAVIKGRTNYLCLRRFGQMVEEGCYDLMRPELRMLASVVAWACTTPDGDFDTIKASGAADPQFLSSLASSSDECQGRGCRHYGRCFVQKARARALSANLVVANHSLVFAELDADVPVALPEHAQIVFDEAHNLEDAATKHFTIELSTGEVAAVTRRLHQVRGKARRGILPSLQKRLNGGVVKVADAAEAHAQVDAAIHATNGLNAAARALCQAFAHLVGERGQTLRYSFRKSPDGVGHLPDPNPLWRAADRCADEFISAASRLKSSLRALAAVLDDAAAEGELNLAAGDAADIKAAITRIDELVGHAEAIADGSDPDIVYWIEKGRGAGADMAAAFAAPVNVGRYLATSVYSKKSSVILCSATLSVAGSFAFMAGRLGLDEIEEGRLATCVAPSPFDYASQCALVIPEYMTPPVAQDRSYTTELSDLVLRLAEHYGGRTMVLFTSYEMMRQCAANIRQACEEGGFSLLVQGESGSRNRMTRVFRQDGRSILFGTQSFWEGVDVMGEALSCVVVARLPFASPGDPIVSARCERIDRDGGNSFSHYSVPLAVLKLRQGFGRLIRHRLDRGTVVIADTRVTGKSYGRTFLRSLPVAARRCATMGEVLASLK